MAATAVAADVDDVPDPDAIPVPVADWVLDLCPEDEGDDEDEVGEEEAC